MKLEFTFPKLETEYTLMGDRIYYTRWFGLCIVERAMILKMP